MQLLRELQHVGVPHLTDAVALKEPRHCLPTAQNRRATSWCVYKGQASSTWKERFDHARLSSGTV